MSNDDFNELKILAKSGDDIAQYQLGAMYATGDGIEKDLGCAIYWYEKAASNFSGEAVYTLGTMYLHGEGVAADPEKATSLFKEALPLGSGDAALSLAWMYENGEYNVTKNHLIATEYYLNAFEFGLKRGIQGVGDLLSERVISADDLVAIIKDYKSPKEA